MDREHEINPEDLLVLLESELLLNISKPAKIKKILTQVNKFLTESPQNKKALLYVYPAIRSYLE